MHKTKLIEQLESGEPTTLVIYGTSLSYHLAPHLRDTLSARFGEALTLANSGLSGKASRTGLQELDSKVLKHQPDTLLVEFAVNDAYSFEIYPDALDRGIDLPESRANLETLIERVHQAVPHCEIIIQTTNPTYDAPASTNLAGTYRPKVATFYQGYRDVAAKQDLTLIDNYGMWEELRRTDPDQFRTLIPDGVHPTPTAIRTVLVPFLLTHLGVEV